MTGKTPIDKDTYKELKRISTLTPENCQKQLLEIMQDIQPSQSRTSQQNRALHKNFSIIANKLNDAGLDMRTTLKADIPWTATSVKEYMWRPIQRLMLGKTSTTELEKHAQIEKIHEVIMRELGQKFGIEWHDFPHDPERKAAFEAEMGIRSPLPVRQKTTV